MAAAVGAVVAWSSIMTGVAISAGVATALTYGIIIGGAILLGNALKPKVPNGSIEGQGAILETKKSNIEAVPVVYGQNRLAGNIIWQTTNNYNGGTTNNDYWAIIVLADGMSQSFVNMFDNNEEMSRITTNIFTSTYVHVQAYNSSGTGTSLPNVTFITDSSGTATSGASIFGILTTPIVSSTSAGSAGALIDGDITTAWTPATPNNEWVKLINNQLTAMRNVRVALFMAQDIDGADIRYQLKLQYSDDDITYTDCSDIVVNQEGDGVSWININNTEQETKHLYWRIYVIQASYNLTIPYPIQEIDYDSDVGNAITIPPDITYIAVHQLFDSTDGKHVQLSNITAELQGSWVWYFYTLDPIPVLNFGYRNNPVNILFDIMKERLGIAGTDIDNESWYEAQQFATSNNLQCNIVFARQENVASAIESVLSTMRGHISYSNGKWKIIYDHYQAPLATLTQADILQGSMNVSMMSGAELTNTVTLRYVNPKDEWQIATVKVQDDTLVALDGQVSEYVLEVRGCTNQEQAYKLARLTLNKMRYVEDGIGDKIPQTPLNISFALSIKNAHVEVGDVYTINHDLLNFNRTFEIVSVETDQSGVLMVNAIEHCESQYKDDLDNFIIS